MIKVSVLYPNTPGARFDHDYYRDRHMPLVQCRLGEACRFYTIDLGLSGAAPGTPPPFVAACHIYTDSPASFHKALARHADEINGDIANYTDITPITQISQAILDDLALSVNALDVANEP